jgi:hypothetical protein
MAKDPKPLYDRYAPGEPIPEPPPAGAPADLEVDEPPLLDRAGLDELKRQLASEPEFTLERVRKIYDADMTEDELRDLIVDLEVAFEDPDAQVAHDLAFEGGLGNTKLPASFTFPRMDLERVPIDPSNCRFETKRDAIGWALNAGPFFLRSKVHQPKVKFRWAEDHSSLFFYKLRGDKKSRLALFADAGTGLYHSRYIGRHIAAEPWDHVLYLGDVYYSGKQAEFDKRFLGEANFGPIIDKSSFWTLNANHEMFSRSVPYMRAIDARRAASPALHQQEGSYFCLRGGKFQVIGIDTAYHESNRHKERKLAHWLQHALVDGRNKGLTNILCSGDHPYDLGKTELTDLCHDVVANLPPHTVDLWVFGNVHFAAFFDRDHDKNVSFLGACIGHGGYPYSRRSEDDRWSAVPVRWVETEARFPAWTEVRQDRGNNGYMTLELDHETGGVELKFIDWLADVRYRLALGAKLVGGPLVILEEQRFARESHGKP